MSYFWPEKTEEENVPPRPRDRGGGCRPRGRGVGCGGGPGWTEAPAEKWGDEQRYLHQQAAGRAGHHQLQPHPWRIVTCTGKETMLLLRSQLMEFISEPDPYIYSFYLSQMSELTDV